MLQYTYVEVRGWAMIRSALDSMLFKNLLLHHETAIYREQINHFFPYRGNFYENHIEKE